MPLFDPKRHEALSGGAWDPAVARDAIDRLCDDATAAFSEDGLWPIHPLDVSGERAATLTPLYYGAAGVAWALDHLGRPISHYLDSLAAITSYPGDGFLLGHLGTLMLLAKHRSGVSEQIPEILSAAPSGTSGMVWGGAGTLLASRFCNLPCQVSLADQLVQHPDLNCRLWLQDLYGATDHILGGLHGFAANAGALIRTGCDDGLTQAFADTVATTAVWDDGFVNWPSVAGVSQRPQLEQFLLQHCFGAPGMINQLSALDLDDHWLAAGETIWAAGPPTKLPGLCHGVSGSGFAFLKLFVKTGDQLWLDRARQFAMHGIVQADDAAAKFGRRKFSLWTGDPGLACFIRACLDEQADIPLLDVF